MGNNTWRQVYAPQIAIIIANLKEKGKSTKEIKKFLCDANPGQYGWMRKVWSNEYMCQLGLSRRKGKIDKDQQNLF